VYQYSFKTDEELACEAIGSFSCFKSSIEDEPPASSDDLEIIQDVQKLISETWSEDIKSPLHSLTCSWIGTKLAGLPHPSYNFDHLIPKHGHQKFVTSFINAVYAHKAWNNTWQPVRKNYSEEKFDVWIWDLGGYVGKRSRLFDSKDQVATDAANAWVKALKKSYWQLLGIEAFAGVNTDELPYEVMTLGYGHHGNYSSFQNTPKAFKISSPATTVCPSPRTHFNPALGSGSLTIPVRPTWKELSKRLLALSDGLSNSESATFRKIGALLNGQHQLYIRTADYAHLHHAFELWNELKDIVKNTIKVVSRTLRNIFKTVKLFIRRDLRSQYRNIIHFLFKNMDDNSGDNEYLFSTNGKKQFSFILNRYHYESQRDYRIFRGPDQ